MKVLIIGATSAIAKAFAQLYARKHGAAFFLVARNAQKIDVVSHDLSARGATAVHSHCMDLNDDDGFSEMLSKAKDTLGNIDIVLMAYGVLGNQSDAEKEVASLKAILKTNAESPLILLTELANIFEAQGSGTIAFISSVAGDRGRPSNYVYGASKAIVTTFLQGMRARLAKSGVHVLTIKPGFVDTPMTADIEKSGPLWAKPEDIALGIDRAIVKKRNAVYLPWFWRIIMGIIVHIPECIFKKLSL